MDIVNRLITYMEAHGIGSTQFADSCGIPRPTLSQILSGRNKKISDAVISKIHNAYPRLSVLWLLFGEGQMESVGNIAATEAQNTPKTASQASPVNVFRAPESALSDEDNESDAGLFGATDMREPLIFDDDEPMREISSMEQAHGQDEAPMVTIPADGSKSIVNIMVFYSDNSYQSFVPR